MDNHVCPPFFLSFSPTPPPGTCKMGLITSKSLGVVKLESFNVPDPGFPSPSWPYVWPTCSHAPTPLTHSPRTLEVVEGGARRQLPQTGPISTQPSTFEPPESKIDGMGWDEIYRPSCEDLPTQNLPGSQPMDNEAVSLLAYATLIPPPPSFLVHVHYAVPLLESQAPALGCETLMDRNGLVELESFPSPRRLAL